MKLLIGIGMFAIVFSACCKAYCVKQRMDLVFIGFNEEQLREITVTQNRRGLPEPHFTFTLPPLGGSDSVQYMLGYSPEDIELSNDFRITLADGQKEYNITDIQTKGFQCGCGQGRGKTVAGYRRDGEWRSDEIVYIIE